ncbi:P-loop containing nucleoside triphosphate hydrolase protein, partial [Morchella snyderi]
MSCPPTLDDTFGPAVAPCRRSLDFTLLFTETILTALPASLFVLLAGPRIYVLLRRRPPTGVRRGWLWWAKGATIALYIGLQIAFLSSTALSPRTRASVPAAALTLVVSLILPALSHLTHTRSRRPDALTTTYLPLTLLFTAAHLRTLHLSYPRLPTALTAATLATSFLLLTLESLPPPPPTNSNPPPPPEETAAPIALSLLTWLLPLLRTGYKSTLALATLPPLPTALTAEALTPRLAAAYSRAPARPLLLTAAAALWRPLLAPVLPRLALVGFTFAQPFLVQRVLSFLKSDEGAQTGWALLGAYAVVYVGIAVATAWYNWMTYRLMVAVRGGLVAMVWAKLLKKPPAPPPDATSAVTLMSTDTERILSGLKYAHEPWANTLECILAIYLLTRQVGLSSLAMVALALVCVALSTLVAARSAALQTAWMRALQTRVSTTAATLSCLKAIKLLNLEGAVSGVLQGLRDKEVEAAGGFRSSVVVSVGLSYATLIFSPVVVFGAFMGVAESSGKTMDVERLFTSLTVIALLAGPLVHLFQALPALSAAWACAGRISAFLAVGEVDNSGGGGAEKGRGDTRMVLGEGEALAVRSGSWGWRGVAAVGGVDVCVRRGQTVMVVGPVGCGKSVLLRGLLGEVPRVGGSVGVCGRMAYCDQTAWLVNDSVRANVVGPGEWDEAWYHTVVRACAIDGAVAGMGGVGSGGVGLSGGQKQRVALARAIYSRREILLLDDIFSGLDRTTTEQLFERLWGADGLLRRMGTTVIFATHGVGYLRYSDTVIALSTDGRVAEAGPTADVLAAGGYVAGLMTGRESKAGDEAEEEGGDEAAAEQQQQLQAPEEAVEEEAEAEERPRDRDVYKYYFKSIGRLNSACFLLGGVCFGVLLKFPDQWLTWWSNSNATHPNERNGYYLGIYAMFNVLAFISLCAWALHLFHGVAASSGRNLHRELLRTVMSAPFPYISRIDTGVTTNRFSQDMLLVDGTLPLSLLNTAAELFTFITQLALIAAASPFILAAFPPLLATTYALQHLYLRTSKQLRLLDISSKSPLYTLFLSATTGLPTLRAHSATSHLTTQVTTALNTSQQPVYLLYCVQVWLNLVLDLLVAGLALTIIAIAVGRRGLLSTSAVGLALVNITTLGETLKSLVVSYTALETSLGAIARLESFSRTTPQEDDNPAPSSSSDPKPPPPPTHGPPAINFHAVSATYTDNGPQVLTDITLSLPPATRTAILGRSGSGKTSLLAALTRLLDPCAGTITLGGVDTRSLRRSDVRAALTVVPQDVYAFPGSVRANLDLEGGCDDAELLGVLSRLGLVGEGASLGGGVGALDEELVWGRLSVGQRQLFGLGRAVVKARGVLVLDEAMSSVDVETERVMGAVVEEEFVGWTVVAVMHRVAGVEGYGRVVIMEAGRIVDEGSVEEVRAR